MAEQFARFVRTINLGQEGDGVDRLHFGRTPMVCMFFSGFLVLIKYMQIRPMLCWIPYEFTNDNWVEYATYFCYVSNTFLPVGKDVFAYDTIDNIEKGNVVWLKYYQWVPLIFISVAIIFYLPRLLWQGVLEAEGINITAMVRSVNGFESALNPANRDRQIGFLAKYMMAHFSTKKRQSGSSGLKQLLGKICFFSRSDASYVGRMYLLLKVLQVTVSVGILFILNVWLDGFHFYGIDVLVSAFKGTYNQTNAFPLVSVCEMDKRDLGDDKTYRFQCLLTMNLFNEKIFVLFWFYLVYVAIVTILNTFFWFLKVLQTSKREAYIRTLLKLSKSADIDFDNPEHKTLFREFVQKFLKPDGVFTFRLINANTTTVVMHEITGKLWNLWKEDKENRDALKEVASGKGKSSDERLGR